MTILELQALHRRVVVPHLGEPSGASFAEVRALERRLGCSLPAAYREYLVWMGRDDAGILRGSNCFIDDVLANNEALPSILRDNAVTFELPAHFVVFFLHQGYIAAWFALPAEQPDPPCWVFAEGQTPRPERCGTLSEFLLTQIRGLAEVLPGARARVRDGSRRIRGPRP